ncbi:MAG TPA: cell division topological specificity factor MinE [Anaerolineales bacterium]|nr:cell division topological specificity factor MinE [Anaerolineales bacterium]HUS85481.1 cell division topological specificity factor MinE [Anaerolineales bacterium]
MNFFHKSRSAKSAKERLQLVLIHDRAGISPGKLDALKDDLISVISRHIEIETDAVEITLTNDRDQHRLVADIPLVPNRKRRHTIS